MKLEGCSETEIIKFEKVGCLQALFGLGAASGPRDFKSAMSTDFIMAANYKIALILALIAVRVKWAEKTCAARVGIPARAAQKPSVAPLAQNGIHQRFVLCGTL